jgi:uncharacterized protein
MGCSYCFADRGRYGSNHDLKLLVPETAAAIIEKVVTNCGSIGHVKFFGGEPLLSANSIKEICSRIGVAFSDGRLDKVPSYNIITNGTIFSQSIAEVLRENSIRITISVDGPKSIHDAQRKFINGRGSFDRISQNIYNFSRAGCRLGVLEAVFTPHHIEQGFSFVSLYKSLVESFGNFFEMVVVHPMDQPTLNQIPDSNAKRRYICEMRDQTRDLYEYLLATDATSPSCLRFSQMLQMLTAETKDENLCGVGYDIITIKPDGTVFSCYVFSDDDEFRYGNILSDNFWELFYSGQITKKMNVASRLHHKACLDCDIRDVCTHCLSGMESNGGLKSILPDINCEFNFGQIEGFFAALQTLKTLGQLDDVCQKIQC